MEDINDKITRLLSSPEGIAKIQSVMASLGGEPLTADLPSLPTTQTADAAPLPPAPATPPPPDGLPDLGQWQKLLPLVGAFSADDADSRLLQALRPYLHGKREERLDEAIRILRLTRLIPLLQEQGLLGNGRKGE